MVHPAIPAPSTLPELLQARAVVQDTAQLAFLNADGSVSKGLSYADLLDIASVYARRLLAAGLTKSDVVLASFPDHESHIYLFWACCLAGIPFCPLPALHPDPSRQTMLFNHLQSLFHKPTLLASAETIQGVHALVPEFKALVPDELPAADPNTNYRVFPALRPSPSDTVCYMLTSGSTGNSKAVLLRHSNLLSSIRGKIRHHGTTANSRFLNWIAFDHVACVSEVHLQALEANASQWHVSPLAIIRNPLNLLRWSSALNVTYTFSPNFLLAAILRDIPEASFDDAPLNLSNLRALISGGEAVPVKTAVAFANIIESFGARRDVLRAGFGMSETGAGSIYDTRPIPKVDTVDGPKYLSLGKCCQGLVMRVVDGESGKICPAGETGQLQISGPSVFSEYYGNERATAESFTDDGWFITGDLAQLDVEGNLSLVGRGKDCVNINGVKYPTQDVEHYVEDQKIMGVMPSYVYICPMRLEDADTETYGVFYQHDFVVEDGLDGSQKRAIRAANRLIKNACTVFCSVPPHVILPLPRSMFVKTALGKVSHARLSTTYLQGDFTALQAELETLDETDELAGDILTTPIEKLIGETIAEIFSVEQSSLRRSQSVFDIGASSMHLLRLKQVLQERLAIRDLPTIEMLKRPQIADLCDYLTAVVTAERDGIQQRAPAYDPLVCMNSSGSKPPLFLVHPGVGEVLVFVALARQLADDRPVYAIRARGFDNGDPTFATFQEMTDCYVSAIERVQPNGPYNVAGYSFGGAVAFEIGKALEAKGKPVSFLGVLNLPPHIQFRMKELSWPEVLLNIGMFLSLIPSSALSPMREELKLTFPEVAANDIKPENPLGPINWLFEKSDQKRLLELDLELGAFTRWVNVAYEINSTGRTFVPQGCLKNALTAVFCAIPLPSMGTREEFKRDRLSVWKEFSGERFEMIDVDGEHYTMLSEEHVVSFAGHMRAALHRAESHSAPSIITPPAIAKPIVSELEAKAEQLAAKRAALLRELGEIDSEEKSVHAQIAELNAAVGTKADFDAVPIIDYSLSQTNPAEYLKQLKFAFEDVGFGVFANVPGFENSFQKEIFSLTEQLFAKPQEWKDRLGTGASPSLRGYFRADTIPEPHKAYAEAYRFGADMPSPGALDDPSVPFWLKLHEGPNQWPAESDLPRFKEMMETLFERYRQLNLELNKHVCELLSIPNQVLDDFFPVKPEFNSAIWHYFPVNEEVLARARKGFVNGMHEHRDPSTFVTCLIQNRAGLQVQNHQGAWIDIPMVEGGVVCNIGMQLMKLTGGKLVATTHRVNTLKIEEDRFTIPYVMSTKLEKPVTPLPQFASPDSAKAHVTPNPKIAKLMSISDPLLRSGYARLTLFPAATSKLYPKEFEEARQMGIV